MLDDIRPEEVPTLLRTFRAVMKQEPQVVIDHQRSEFGNNSYLISWNTLNNVTSDIYWLKSTDDCQPDTNPKSYINGQPVNHITLNSSDLVGADNEHKLRYFSLSSLPNNNSEEASCFSLESFQIDPNGKCM